MQVEGGRNRACNGQKVLTDALRYVKCKARTTKRNVTHPCPIICENVSAVPSAFTVEKSPPRMNIGHLGCMETRDTYSQHVWNVISSQEPITRRIF